MGYDSICTTKADICSVKEITGQNNNTNEVQIIIDEFGNMEIIDPQNELGAVYSENEGNFSSTGTKADNFRLDNFGNFKFIP